MEILDEGGVAWLAMFEKIMEGEFQRRQEAISVRARSIDVELDKLINELALMTEGEGIQTPAETHLSDPGLDLTSFWDLHPDQAQRYDRVFDSLTRAAVRDLRSVDIEVSPSELRARISHSRRWDTVPRVHALPSPPEMAAFIAAAVASGIVGNLAYDVMRLPLVRAWRSMSHESAALAPTASQQPMDLLVRLAIVEQCARHELTAPSLESLTVTKWVRKSESIIATVVGNDQSNLNATVVIPCEMKDLRVTIRTVETDSMIAERARNDWFRKYSDQ